MVCLQCQTDNPAGTITCLHCNTPLESGDATQPMGESPETRGWGVPGAATPVPMVPGTVLGDRYEILQVLGQGGMGAVYKARDREVDRLVALKVIRPELAERPEILRRFRQELILARKVTHKNAVRIFDLGQAGGLKFITMEFVEGRDVGSLLEERGKFPPEEAVNIIKQVCRALEAAHSEGVVHRDLKPQNIMVDERGRALVMDFGIAHSMEPSGLTQTGALLGTPQYMSPEQVRGEHVDARSDLFTVGLILYELLTGRLPFQSETVVGTLLKRTQETALPPVRIDPAVPAAINEIVMKCLARDPAERYQSATELLGDLEAVLPSGQTILRHVHVRRRRRWRLPPPSWKWTAAAALAAALVLAGVYVGPRLLRKSEAPKPVALLIADFENRTGDSVFDGTLESMFKIALEGADFVTAYDRTQMRNLGLPAADKLDEPAARRVALSQGLGVVISGSLDRQGGGYGLSVRASQAVTGNTIANTEVSAPNKDQVLFAVTKAAATIRTALGDATSESAQRFAMETLTATSLEAVHEYALAMDFLSNGRFEEARRSFSRASDLDANFGLAYAGMAIASRNLHQAQDAQKYIKLAITHIDSMTERERYRTRGLFYFLHSDHQKCMDEYSALIARYSSDAAAHNNLALCSTQLRNMPKAIEEMRRAVEILPKRALYHVNLALYMSYGSDFQRAEREARAVLQLDPSLAPGLLALAFAQLGQGQLSQAAETYRKLEKTNAWGASTAAEGLADIALYDGRFSDAIRILEQGAAADVATQNSDRAAAKFAALAYAQLSRGQNRPALAAAETALSNSKSARTRFLVARVFVAAGEVARARKLASGLAAELQTEPQAYAKLIEGEAALVDGDPRQAIKVLTEASRLVDTWIGRFDLGRAYLEAVAFAEADSEFDRCINRRGESLSLFLDESPTYGYFPPVYYYQGRVREGLRSSGFAESYRKYLHIRGKAGEDPLLAEARRQAAAP